MMDSDKTTNSDKLLQTSSHSTTQDAQDLVIQTGHVETLTRKFSFGSLLALSFCVLGTWSTFAQDLGSGLNNGGPVSILWGLLLVTFCNICVALSLGEMCSAMPTALGQAYWIHRIWNTSNGRIASYMCAWINTFGWWALTASQIAFMGNFLLGMKVMFDPEWAGASEGWVQFLVYIGITLLLTVANLVACRKDKILPIFNNFVGWTFGGLFVVFSLALLIKVGITDSLSYQPASFTFGYWNNQTGWSDGVVWFTGLVQAAYGLTAFDACFHMIEEIPNPRRNGPRIVWMAVLVGAITGFLFMVVCLFTIQDFDAVTDPASGLPFIELIQETIGTNGGCALVALFVFNGLCQGVSVMTTASRLTWGFARDAGLPWSSYFSHVDPIWKVPARALWLQGVIIAIIGVLYLFANTVLEAILSVSTIALTISYGMPIVVLLIVGRDKLPPGEFRLRGVWGPVLNWVSVVYCSITTVFFFFPSSPSPDPADMNWAIAVFGVMLIVAVGFWFIQGKRTFLNSEEAAERLETARALEIIAQRSTEGYTDAVK